MTIPKSTIFGVPMRLMPHRAGLATGNGCVARPERPCRDGRSPAARRARATLRVLTAAILMAGVVAASPAQAQRHRGDYHGYSGRTHNNNNTAAIIGGIIGLGLSAAILGSVQPPPAYYYPPPPAYYPPYRYYPPPPPPTVYYGAPY